MAELGLGLCLHASFLPKSSFPTPSSSVARIEAVRCMNNAPMSYSKSGKKEHHLWMKRDTAGSGQKALHLVRIVSKLPNEKGCHSWSIGQMDCLGDRISGCCGGEGSGNSSKDQWLRIIQVSKWLLSKGQVLTMGTYDSLLLAFERDGRLKEAEELWRIILQRHTRSVSKRLFSRMIALYDHHHFF